MDTLGDTEAAGSHTHHGICTALIQFLYSNRSRRTSNSGTGYRYINTIQLTHKCTKFPVIGNLLWIFKVSGNLFCPLRTAWKEYIPANLAFSNPMCIIFLPIMTHSFNYLFLILLFIISSWLHILKYTKQSADCLYRIYLNANGNLFSVQNWNKAIICGDHARKFL